MDDGVEFFQIREFRRLRDDVQLHGVLLGGERFANRFQRSVFVNGGMFGAAAEGDARFRQLILRVGAFIDAGSQFIDFLDDIFVVDDPARI